MYSTRYTIEEIKMGKGTKTRTEKYEDTGRKKARIRIRIRMDDGVPLSTEQE